MNVDLRTHKLRLSGPKTTPRFCLGVYEPGNAADVRTRGKRGPGVGRGPLCYIGCASLLNLGKAPDPKPLNAKPLTPRSLNP